MNSEINTKQIPIALHLIFAIGLLASLGFSFIKGASWFLIIGTAISWTFAYLVAISYETLAKSAFCYEEKPDGAGSVNPSLIFLPYLVFLTPIAEIIPSFFLNILSTSFITAYYA